MKKYIIAIASLIAFSFTASAQDEGNWYFGGGIGMSFGDYTNINVAPQVGYRFGRHFSLGAGVSYNYYKDKDYDNTLNYLGANLNAKLYPIDYLFVFVQPEVQHRWGRLGREKRDESTFGVMLAGAGLSLPVSYNTRLVVSAYYDVLQNKHTPHGDKVGYSVGISFGF